MEMMPDYSNPDVKKHVREILSMFVGHGRSMTWARLAEMTWDGEATVATWERRLRSYVDQAGPLMPLDIFMRVFTVLPPAAFQRFAAKMGFSAGPLEPDAVNAVRRAGRAAARISAKIAGALEDGLIDHAELADIENTVFEEGPHINSVLGGGSALN